MRCWVDGRLVDVRDARVSPLDAGWRLGDGVFSTLRAVDGVPQRLATHVARTVHDAAAIGITAVAADDLAEAARAVAAANAGDHDDLVLRLVVTRGAVAPDAPFGTAPAAPSVAVLASPAPAPDGPVRAVTVAGARRPAAVKSTSWAWSSRALAVARAAGADTAILTEDGDVLEAAAANVVVVHGEVAATPPADGRLLPGTTRALLLDRGLLVEDDVPTTALATATEVVLLSAVRGAVPVVAVDAQPVGAGTPGPVAARLATALRDAGVGPPER